MGWWETYIALIKGYCALMILVLPKSFTNGGYLFSAFCLATSAIVQAIAALKLVETAKQIGVANYSLIAYKALGPCSRIISDIMIFLT